MEYLIVTSARTSALGNGLSYAGPEGIAPGSLVRVPLRGKFIEGIVIQQAESSSDFTLKEIHEVLSEEPLLSPAQLQTLQWMSREYCCSLRHALSVWLPPPPWQSVLPKEQTWYRLADTEAEVRGAKQQLILEMLRGGNAMEESVLREEADASLATLRGLTEKGILQRESRKELYDVTPATLDRLPLSEAQQQCYQDIKAEPKPSVLFGVTGSGKTHVYASLIADCIEAGKHALLLTPEILLSEFTQQRFTSLIDSQAIAVLHSRLTPAERRDTWRRIRSGQVRLVIGSRSALFSPLQNLGVVILDEEHEWTYKNEQTPRYHARETAEALCMFSKAKLILGSATPSLETWNRCKAGRYALHRLPDRHGGATMPTVRIIDLATANFGSLYPLTTPLLEAIESRIQKKEQSILFLNRRGTASALLCLDCRRRVVSPESQLPFTVHVDYSGSPYLLDHSSGLRSAVPERCPACQSARLHAVGAGTQRLENLIQRQFPNARVLRADTDTLTKPDQMKELLDTMQRGEADILLGTQIVAKGLDLPKVTLAAVLVADVGLSLPHFRAGERVFQLLTQLTGRSGRFQAGEVIIQTYRPDAPEVKLAAEHQTETYLEQELKLRTYAKYPPTTRMVRLSIRGPHAADRAKTCAATLRKKVSPEGSLLLSASPTLFEPKTWHILIRGANPLSVLQNINLDDIVVDVDPLDCV